GLSTLVSSLKDVVQVPYSQLQGFGESTVVGQKGMLAFGLMGKDNVPVVAMLGRFHLNKRHNPTVVTYGIRIMKRLGVKDVISEQTFDLQDTTLNEIAVVVIRDHLALPNLTGMNP
ncbi:hypothetical protein EDD22DRAFT_728217, partial [Suillus occidentalis]